jgi:hypothetical protein
VHSQPPSQSARLHRKASSVLESTPLLIRSFFLGASRFFFHDTFILRDTASRSATPIDFRPRFDLRAGSPASKCSNSAITRFKCSLCDRSCWIIQFRSTQSPVQPTQRRAVVKRLRPVVIGVRKLFQKYLFPTCVLGTRWTRTAITTPGACGWRDDNRLFWLRTPRPTGPWAYLSQQSLNRAWIG